MKKLVEIEKINKLISLIAELEVKSQNVNLIKEFQYIKKYITYEILEMDKLDVNELKRSIYAQMIKAKEEGNEGLNKELYKTYQMLKKESKKM